MKLLELVFKNSNKELIKEILPHALIASAVITSILSLDLQNNFFSIIKFISEFIIYFSTLLSIPALLIACAISLDVQQISERIKYEFLLDEEEREQQKASQQEFLKVFTGEDYNKSYNTVINSSSKIILNKATSKNNLSDKTQEFQETFKDSCAILLSELKKLDYIADELKKITRISEDNSEKEYNICKSKDLSCIKDTLTQLESGNDTETGKINFEDFSAMLRKFNRYCNTKKRKLERDGNR